MRKTRTERIALLAHTREWSQVRRRWLHHAMGLIAALVLAATVVTVFETVVLE